MGIFAAAPSCGSATVARAIKDASRFGFLAVSRRKIEFIGHSLPIPPRFL